jgi:hypothetical protein
MCMAASRVGCSWKEEIVRRGGWNGAGRWEGGSKGSGWPRREWKSAKLLFMNLMSSSRDRCRVFGEVQLIVLFITQKWWWYEESRCYNNA